MTFEEIGKELGVSMQRAKQIYDNAMEKAKKTCEREGITIEEVMEDLKESKTMFDALEEGMLYDSAEDDDLRGFWNEANNKGSSL